MPFWSFLLIKTVNKTDKKKQTKIITSVQIERLKFFFLDTKYHRDREKSLPPCNAFTINISHLNTLLIRTAYVGKCQCLDVDYLDTWRAMEKLVESGRVRSIGISNFNSEQTQRVLSIAKILPVTNQVECHPNLNQRKLIDFSAARNITVTAYSPLGRPHTQSGKKLAISDAKVLELAQKYKKSPAQILLRYTVSSSVA